MHVNPNKAVILDKLLITSKAGEGALLSEEIGHFETGALYVIDATYNLPVSRSNRIKYEAVARHWAYRVHLPALGIEAAVESEGTDEWSIAEWCQVPVWFLREAVEYYRSCGIVFSFDEHEDRGQFA